MKKLGLALVIAAVASSPVAAGKAEPSSLNISGATYLSGNCQQICRECILNGETCAICGPNCCGCN
jgi:hypothetical protein